MTAPDLSKYDETQLRQILTRIDRERFPERVSEIEARLEAFRVASLAKSPTHKPTGTGQPPAAVLDRSGVATLRWLLAGALLIILVGGSILVQRTSAARDKWFENQAQMEQHGVEADAVIIAKACAGRTVRYRWKWGEKQLEGGGWSCNSTCTDAKLGDKAQIRFLPTNPGDVRCVPDDIEAKLGPPNYHDPILFLIIFVAVLFGPFLRLGMSQVAEE